MYKRLLSLAFLLLGAAPAPPAPNDLVILGGRVIDPASGLDRVASIAVRDGRIVAIGAGPMTARRVIRADGLTVAPGFIDLHSHAQEPVGQRLQLMDGVTTALDLELGAMPIRRYLQQREGRALINYGASAAHLCARLEVFSTKRCDGHAITTGGMTADIAALKARPTPAEEDRIVAALDREIDAGAIGYGLGLEYTPGAGRREVFRIFEAAAKRHAPVFVHLRVREPDRADGVALAVVNEVIGDAAATGAPLHIVHIVSSALVDTPTALALVRGARRHGVDVTTEVYPYVAGSTLIGSELFAAGWERRLGIGPEQLLWPTTGERLSRATFDRYRREQPDGTVIIFANPDTAVDAAVADSQVLIGSDAMAALTDHEHPRGAGTFARVLGVYAREKKAVGLTQALAKMTILPARRLETAAPRMARKGRLQVGMDADITIFDAATVADRATFAQPMLTSAGIPYVIVAGQVMVDNGKLVPGQYPGRPIVSGSARHERSTRP